MSRYNLKILCLGLSIAGFAVGVGGVTAYFRGDANPFLYMFIGWVLFLAGGLYLLVTALEEEKVRVKEKKDE